MTTHVLAFEQHRVTPAARPAVPWSTVIPLAVVMAFGDGFWVISLRGAVGAIERTQTPFSSWLRESTELVPIYAVAVLGALLLAMRWFGAGSRGTRAIVATGALVAAAGTVAGAAVLAASAWYDYHLQVAQLGAMGSMDGR